MSVRDLVSEYDAVLKSRLEKLRHTCIPLSDGTEFRPPTFDEASEIYQTLVSMAASHLSETGFKSVVVPASGGADSTFMLSILRDAADYMYSLGVARPKIIGFTLPCHLQTEGEYLDDMGVWACELYADDWATVNIGPIFNQVRAFMDPSTIQMASGKSLADLANEVNPNYPDREYRVDRGNVAARLRMLFSYGIAKRLGGAQASTDNLSEGLEGFWTLCGDEGTFKYIQGMWKGLEQPVVMAAAGIPSPFFCQVETDGLGVGDGDCAQLYGRLWTGKETYYDVDSTLLRYFQGQHFPDILNPDVPSSSHPVVQWHLRTEFKRSPFSLGRRDLGLKNIPGLTFAQ
tara:strand:- start:80 stop:1114 length:1035 start_codon:yes stop_codon:yes gene_type:complete